LRDLTLFAIGCVISVRWFPIAAHVGPGSVTLWLLAAVFFVVPLTIAVAGLVAKYPGAGGLYLWTISVPGTDFCVRGRTGWESPFCSLARRFCI